MDIDRPSSRTPTSIPPICPRTSVFADLPQFIRPITNLLDPVDLDYLAKKGAFCLPEERFRQQLLDSYFDFVNTFMPLFDKANIQDKFNGVFQADGDTEDDSRISLLLVQAILFAGSAVSQEQHR